MARHHHHPPKAAWVTAATRWPELMRPLAFLVVCERLDLGKETRAISWEASKKKERKGEEKGEEEEEGEEEKEGVVEHNIE